METPSPLGSGASSISGELDLLYIAVTAVTILFSAAIFGAILYFAVKYRRGNRVDRSNPPQHNTYVELAWTIIPMGIALGIFAWATSLFFTMVRVPPDALDIHVVGKQWMWKLQQPTGRWEMNELHVPVGRPVVLSLTSEDVIHSFFVPAFRVKQDVVPGQFTKLWFTPTKAGEYPLMCAEFCGTLHSTMVGTVTVMEPADYERWLAEGNQRLTVAAEGASLFRKHGCSGCHAGNSSVRAPLLEGIYGRPVPVQVRKPGVPLEETPATTVEVDLRYVHDSIVLPEKEIAAGYKPIMPTFKDRLSEEEILKLVAYIRSLAAVRPPQAGRDHSGSLSSEDYEARTGFIPENIRELTGKAPVPPGAGPNTERTPR